MLHNIALCVSITYRHVYSDHHCSGVVFVVCMCFLVRCPHSTLTIQLMYCGCPTRWRERRLNEEQCKSCTIGRAKYKIKDTPNNWSYRPICSVLLMVCCVVFTLYMVLHVCARVDPYIPFCH